MSSYHPKLLFSIIRNILWCTLVSCEVYRLPQTIKPVRYTLTLETDLESDLKNIPYRGSIAIELEVLENTGNITLHKKGLEIYENTTKVTDSDGREINILATSEDQENDVYIITFDGNLVSEGSYNLTIGKFTNTLSTKNQGFYLAKYKSKSGTEKSFAITHFEPNFARTAFPCFDEPGIKSKFIINIIRTEEYNSVSNQELEKTIYVGDGRFQDTFKETPRMPAYLVAFAISDYEHTEKMERHRIFGKPSDVGEGAFNYTLSMSVRILKALEEYTGIPFVLEKIDQFAVPNKYFESDAMENWGLITYGESNLLCTNTSAAEDLQYCIANIAHEFAHQWFGNLVTPTWWKYIWLSESFATYFQYYITSIVQPEWRFMDLFNVKSLQEALSLEFLSSKTALNYQLTSMAEFDYRYEIIYLKGSSILRMVEHILTKPIFRKGIQVYLQNRKFSTAEPSDLYNAWQKAVDDAGKNDSLGSNMVSDVMSTWDSNDDFPVLTVTRDYVTGSIRFQQDPFARPNNSNSWIIPVNYIFESSDTRDFSRTTPDFWLSQKNIILDYGFPTSGWLIVNKQQTGYYRVNYDQENWERIISFLNSKQFKSVHVLNRAQLIDDAFNLAKKNYIPYDIPLRLSEYLIQERDYIPFDAFYRGTDSLKVHFPESRYTNKEIQCFENYTLKNQITSGSSQYEIYKEYLTIVLTELLNYLGFEENQGDGLLDRLNRAELARRLCRIKHPKCVKLAIEKVRELRETNTTYLSPDVEHRVLCEGMRNATEEEFRALQAFYNASTDLYQRNRLCSALHCSKYPYNILCKYVYY